MSCRCQKHRPGAQASLENSAPTDYTTLPDEPCDICAEKHFSTAFALASESGYEGKNLHRIVGELTAATWHTFEAHRELAEQLRDLRHNIQLKRKADPSKWEPASTAFHELLKFRQVQWLCSGDIFPDFRENVWIISNCDYPRSRLVPAGPDDLLIFLNKAKSLEWYAEHPNRAIFHRSPEPSYGDDSDKTAEHYYCFNGKTGNLPHIPTENIRELKAGYDWNYPIEEGKVRSATAGYMVVQHLAKVLPNAHIALVNFGYKVERSSYRCPWHNWQFEAKELEKFPHFYTAEVTNE